MTWPWNNPLPADPPARQPKHLPPSWRDDCVTVTPRGCWEWTGQLDPETARVLIARTASGSRWEPCARLATCVHPWHGTHTTTTTIGGPE